ncbi:MAG: phosphatidate cytidylyltransferase [Sedimentisphaerales bacterium]|nr:phosphatidate cytidylyltransferase [Sedimentisphaerales bacterium]
MLKHRLLFGILMTVLFLAVVIFDGWLDGSLTATGTENKQGTIFCILVALLAIPAQLEMSKLAAAKNLRIFVPVAIVASILLATSRYVLQFAPQFIANRPELYVLCIMVFSLLALFVYQNRNYGTSGVLANCGINCLSILYLGLLSGFCVAIRVDFGLWELLMFVFVIKSADIGAYSIGTLFGKHKFSPKISPGKSWEGMAGAVAAAIIAAIGFAVSCDIMSVPAAIVFGFCFAFIGQLGDLAESMMKRDAEQKDSANKIPGFGGVLDIIDSLLVAAPFAYLFFMWCSR